MATRGESQVLSSGIVLVIMSSQLRSMYIQ